MNKKIINDIKAIQTTLPKKADLIDNKVPSAQLPPLNYLPTTGGVINGDLQVTGDINGARIFGSFYNDYAELFEKYDKDIDYKPHYLISLNMDSDDEMDIYCYSTEEDSTSLVGVVSNSYGHLLGGDLGLSREENLKKYIPIALAGRVYVYIKGKAKKGDLITSSDIPGISKVSTLLKPGSIVGKVLQNKYTDDIGLIKIFVMNI